MTEADVKRKIADSFKTAGAYARRIEDTYAVGVFDMLLIPIALPVFCVEVKVVRDNYFGPTPRQMVELTRIEMMGEHFAIPLMIGFKEGRFYFHKPQMKIHIGDCYQGDMSKPFYNQLIAYYQGRKEHGKSGTIRSG